MSSEIKKGLGWAAAIIVFLGSQFWGVPYYISYVVAQQNKDDAATAQTPAEVTTLIAQMTSVDAFMLRSDASDIRIESKIDHLIGLYIEDLERRAERGD